MIILIHQVRTHTQTSARQGWLVFTSSVCCSTNSKSGRPFSLHAGTTATRAGRRQNKVFPSFSHRTRDSRHTATWHALTPVRTHPTLQTPTSIQQGSCQLSASLTRTNPSVPSLSALLGPRRASHMSKIKQHGQCPILRPHIYIVGRQTFLHPARRACLHPPLALGAQTTTANGLVVSLNTPNIKHHTSTPKPKSKSKPPPTRERGERLPHLHNTRWQAACQSSRQRQTRGRNAGGEPSTKQSKPSKGIMSNLSTKDCCFALPSLPSSLSTSSGLISSRIRRDSQASQICPPGAFVFPSPNTPPHPAPSTQHTRARGNTRIKPYRPPQYSSNNHNKAVHQRSQHQINNWRFQGPPAGGGPCRSASWRRR